MPNEFVYKLEGSKFEDSIDPVEIFQETDSEFIIHNGDHEYVIPKSELEYYRIQEVGTGNRQPAEGDEA